MASVQSRPTLIAALRKAQLHRSWVRPRRLNTRSQRSPSALGKTRVPLSEHAVPSQVYTSLLTHSCCPQPQGTPRQPQARWVERKGTHARPVSRDASEGAGCWVDRRHFTLPSKALAWERRADRQHCVSWKEPHWWEQGKRSEQPLQSQQSRLFTPLFVCSFRLKRLSRFAQVSALEKWANWIWALGQLAAETKEQKAGLILWIGYQSTACAPWSFPVGSPSFCRAQGAGCSAAQICPRPYPWEQFHMQGWAIAGRSPRQLGEKENKKLQSNLHLEVYQNSSPKILILG